MATLAQPQAIEAAEKPHWFLEFLRNELTPYPGRAAIVARITVSVVISFLLVMTLEIPVIPMTLYMAFLIARETPSAAFKSTLFSIAGIGVGIAMVLLGVKMFADDPMLNFLFLDGMFFLLFFLVRALAQTSAAMNMGLGVYSAFVLWDAPYPAEQHLQRTLWVFASFSMALLIALAVELVSVRNPAQEVISGLSQRLNAFEALLLAYAEQGPQAAESAAAKQIATLASVGTGRLRRQMRAAENGHARFRQYYAELHTVIALLGRLVDVSATMRVSEPLTAAECERLRRLAAEVRRIRGCIDERQRPDAVVYPLRHEASPEIPLLPELEKTVSFIPQAFSPSEAHKVDVIATIDEEPRTRIFVADAFANKDYLRFALKGCLATTICHILYSALAWPGISTCVITCLVTALTTVGASQQKQFLRICGATLGGLVLGLGSQAFMVPEMQSITSITLLLAAVTAVGAWFATSSPRLSYLGLQMCLAFYLTEFQGFTNPTSLTPAWNHFAGVLIGLAVMWVVFEHIWPERAADGMLRGFASNLRLIARLATVFESTDRAHVLQSARKLRELINAGFAAVHSHADTVLFEFGPERKEHLAMREQILRRQASARTLFLVQIAIVQYRIQIDYRLVPEELRKAQLQFDQSVARALESIAEGEPHLPDLRADLGHLETALSQGGLPAQAHGILTLSEQLVGLVESAV